ncbi:MAG: DUF2283 domain-containing protein [Nanoarchaeota archaeon]
MDKKYNYDKESDSLFINIKDGEEESFEEIAPGINIELNENNEVIGIEVLKASRFLKGLKKTEEMSG